MCVTRRHDYSRMVCCTIWAQACSPPRDLIDWWARWLVDFSLRGQAQCSNYSPRASPPASQRVSTDRSTRRACIVGASGSPPMRRPGLVLALPRTYPTAVPLRHDVVADIIHNVPPESSGCHHSFHSAHTGITPGSVNESEKNAAPKLSAMHGVPPGACQHGEHGSRTCTLPHHPSSTRVCI
jgi:hypothetical protein